MSLNPNRLSLPGILHFLQYEWKRFECERQQWYAERAELVAQLGMLKGELMAHINIKNDLVRRIKMLEYCIKNERYAFSCALIHFNEFGGILNKLFCFVFVC